MNLQVQLSPKKNINKKSDDTDEDADASFGEELEENISKRVEYILYKSYENTDDALNEIVNNKISNVSWGKRNMKNTHDGQKQFYKCSFCIFIYLPPLKDYYLLPSIMNY